MPKKQRMYQPSIPSHIVQRGNDRKPCFFEYENYLFFLDCLENAIRRYQVAVHAYVLMTNHIHLLMTPSTESSISRVMHLVGNRYIQYINKKYGRTSRLWEGRHKASLVDAQRYLLTCYRYIEMNPIRAGMVGHPSHYRWSSYRHHAGGSRSSIIEDLETFQRLAPTTSQRILYYRSLFHDDLDIHELEAARKAATFSMPLGDSCFKTKIEATLGRSIGHAKRGTP
jgi:putative transposase